MPWKHAPLAVRTGNQIELLWLHARDDLIDMQSCRVRLQDYFSVARFGASFYIRTRDRFGMNDQGVESHSTPIDEIR